MTPEPSPILSQQTQTRPNRKRGVALVLVVGLLALMTMLMLATVTVTDSDFKTEASSFEQGRVRLLADSAVAIAQAKMVEATSQQFLDGTPKPWTSQPGAIRVHNMDGTLEKLYKLYSAPVATAFTVAETTGDLPTDWAQQKESFVDLNEPQRLPGGGLHFPIVDPRAMTTDPLTNVEGFRYEPEKGAIGPNGGAEDAQRLPMPVRWIYMLEDGTLGTMSSEGIFAPRDGDAQPSASNPIVGRFAWWVDDETSKININTASEGSFWDVPVGDTKQERSLAKSQPTRLEYSRQPGHPAGVSLSSVLLPGRRQYPDEFQSTDNRLEPMNAEDARDLWRIGRQLSADNDTGTSFGGYRETDWSLWWPRSPQAGTRQPRYATTDELMFDTSPAASALGARIPHSFFSRHPEAAERIPRSHFFLTTCSTAPEVTLFGTPRVALWPVHATTLLNAYPAAPTSTSHGAPRRDSAYDHRVADVAMLNGQPFFVQRSEPGNGANDFEAHADGANKRLFAYLQRLTSRHIPGFDRPQSAFGTFAEKYGAGIEQDRDAILISMLDYVRACNFSDGQLPKNNQFSVLCPGMEHQGFGQVSPMQPLFTDNQASARTHPQGIGRVLTMSEIALIIVCRAEVDGDKNIQGEPNPENREYLTEPGDRELEVGILVEGFVPGQGWADYRPYANVAIFGGAPSAPLRPIDVATNALPAMRVNGKLLEKVTGSTMMESPELPPKGWQGAGGSIGFRSLSHGVIKFKPIVIKGSSAELPPDLSFMGGSHDAMQLKVALYDSPGSTSLTDLLQVVPLKLPDILAGSGIKLPRLPVDLAGAYPNDPTVYGLADRMQKSAETGRPMISNADIVQSLAPLHGDYRMSSTQRWAESRNGDVRIPVFVPHPSWGSHIDGEPDHAHTLCDPTLPNNGSTGAGYIPSLSYGSSARAPDMPAPLRDRNLAFKFWNGNDWTTATIVEALEAMRLDDHGRGLTPNLPELTGDFDNGSGNVPDGPYSSRPDDGNWASVLNPAKVPYFDGVSQVGSSTPPVSTAAFSPQRLFPSPVVFGSLPTGSRVHVPWQTLLFRPQTTHFGAKSPPDHLLLDLFWCPVIDPEPLGMGLETEGKINLNYQMVPFSHIRRATALHAALKAETLTAIPDSAAATYKSGAGGEKFRHYIDALHTIRFWERKVFDDGGAFLTASQICELPLVPEGLAATDNSVVTTANINEFWAKHRLTGDNSKERPYARLYSRFTTRSNSYRIHFVAQCIKKARSTPANTYDPVRDRLTATFRGSRLLRRTLDMNDPRIPDYLSTTSPTSQPTRPLDECYVWSLSAVEK